MVTVANGFNNQNTSKVWRKFVEAIDYLMKRRAKQSKRNYVYNSFSSFYKQTNEFILDSRFINELDYGLNNDENKSHSGLIFIEMNSIKNG